MSIVSIGHDVDFVINTICKVYDIPDFFRLEKSILYLNVALTADI